MASKTKVFNDPIHGHIELHELLVAIIDTPQFQRLRYIKQLGGGYFVFPGASHNRFEHSLGVAYLAGEFVSKLCANQPELDITEKDILCVEIAGLCHDLGHGPFSHVFDQKFIPKVTNGSITWKHEDASKSMLEYVIMSNEAVKNLFSKYNLNENDKKFIKEMIEPPDLTNVTPGNWPCEGRSIDKSFLYEIVSNNKYGVDVDKWDYFARDCHGLGIANNFDHRRYMMFARVIEVSGVRQICCRDKEVHNLYEMFHTRYTLHQRACQHKTKIAVEIMITEALEAADEHFLKAVTGKTCKMSESIYNMELYSTLTDSVIQTIMMLRNPELKTAQDIILQLQRRQLYKCIGQALDTNSPREMTPNEIEDGIFQLVSKECILQRGDLFVDIVTFDYSMKDQDPLKYMKFYRKEEPDEAKRISKERVSRMLPGVFKERKVFAYCKNNFEIVAKSFHEWCKTNGYSVSSNDSDSLSTSYATPTKECPPSANEELSEEQHLSSDSSPKAKRNIDF